VAFARQLVAGPVAVALTRLWQNTAALDSSAHDRGTHQEEEAGVTEAAQSPESSHQEWIRNRLLLEEDMMARVGRGFSLIAAGFGSFSVLSDIIGALGQGEEFTTPTKSIALVSTAAGVISIVLATRGYREMVAWIDADEFGPEPAPTVPAQGAVCVLTVGAVIIGIISFLSLLLFR
jgi:hypothetical protein